MSLSLRISSVHHNFSLKIKNNPLTMFVSFLWTPCCSVVGKYLFLYFFLVFESSGPGPGEFNTVGTNFLIKIPRASRMSLNRPHCRCPRVSPSASGALPRSESRWSGWFISGNPESWIGGGEAFPGDFSYRCHAGEHTDA